MSDAEACFDEGMKHIGLSHHADYHSEYVGDLEDAVACFDRALALNADHAAAWSEKGTALAILGRHEEAAAALAEAIRLRPGVAELWLESAGSLNRLGRYEEAVAACDATLRLRLGDADAMFLRAESLEALDRNAEALAAWDEVLGQGDLRTMNFHGRTVRAISNDFRRLRALLSRAAALARLERRAAAIDAYRRSIDEGAALAMSSSEQFSAALATHDAARDAYQAYIESHADDPLVWRKAGDNFLKASRAADAMAAYERVVDLAPKDADAWIGKAEALVQSGRRTEAIAAFREALRIKPGYLAASLRLERVQKEIARAQSDDKRPV
jgi:tetratricopeptide (TPR) repeat protein